MKVALIPGLYFKSYTRFTEARIPFEILGLCSTIEAVGTVDCEVVDFNLRADSVQLNRTSARFPGLSLDEQFYDRAAGVLEETRAQLFLFPISIHTNGNLFHSLRIAGRLKATSPDVLVVFAGLGPSSRHLDLMGSYPFVDAVLRGEAEASLSEVVSTLSELPEGEGWRTRALEQLESLAGLTARSVDGRIIVTDDRKLVEDLDTLAMPALPLYGPVISVAARQVESVRYLSVEEHIHLEAGRGCPFSCTFCSNTYLWRRRYRLKSADRLVSEIRAAKALGGRKFLLHQQLFTANRTKTRAFCEQLIESGLDIEWSCFTRTDCVSPEILALMKRSGCNTIMFGIESGSERIQDLLRKKADLSRMRDQIAMTIEHGIKPQLSYIIGFPEETREELQSTFDMYCHYKFREGVEAQIGLLVPASGTEILENNLDNLAFDGVQTTTWYTRFFDGGSYDEMAEHPLVFPQNHYLPTSHVSRELLHFIKVFDMAASYLRRSCKYTVLRGLAAFPYEAYELYSRWKEEASAAARVWDGRLRWDSELLAIVDDFARFLCDVIAPRDINPRVLRGMVAFEIAIARVNQGLREHVWEEICAYVPGSSTDLLPREMIVETGIDVDEAFDSVDLGDLDYVAELPLQPSTYRIAADGRSKLRVECLSEYRHSVRHEDIFRQVEF